MKKYFSNFWHWATIVLFAWALSDKNWDASFGWFCVILCEVKQHILDTYIKWLECDRDVWYKRFIKEKYGI